ncbi:MAG: hypothetical protein ABID61_03700 [Candidatus Micrarchaeota archaeon]
MVKIGFRVNFKTGSDNIQRCLTIASGLLETDPACEIFFFTSSSGSHNDKIINAGGTPFDFGPINTPSEDLEATEDAIKRYGIEILLLDSYSINEHYLKSIKPKVKLLVVLDDYPHLQNYHSNILINPNLYAHLLQYTHDDDTELLFGTEFFPLEKEFDQYTDFEHTNSDEVKHILVMFEGNDSKSTSILTVKALKTLQNHFSVTIIIDKLFKNSEALAKEIGLDSRFIVLQDVKEIAKKMASCDLAISNPGSKFYEFAFFKIPTVFISYANYRPIFSDYTSKNGLTILLNGDESAESLGNQLGQFISDKNERIRLSARMDDLVDGLGRFRIADEILKMYKEKTEMI